MLRFCLFFLLLVALISCGNQKIAEYSSKSQEISEDIAENEIDTMIETYRLEMKAKMDHVIGYSDSTLTKYEPESPLSNFVADIVMSEAMKFSTGNDEVLMSKVNSFCILNFGGLRATINQGKITIGNIYELMPFDNTIVITKLKSVEIDSIYNYLYKANGQPLSNCQFNLSSNDNLLTIGGQVYDGESEIYVVTSDYLFGGGDKMNFFKKSVKYWDTGILIRDALIDAVTKMKNVPFYPVENRIIITE